MRANLFALQVVTQDRPLFEIIIAVVEITQAVRLNMTLLTYLNVACIEKTATLLKMVD